MKTAGAEDGEGKSQEDGTQAQSSEGVDIRWHTNRGRQGKAVLTRKALEFLRDEDYSGVINFLGLEDLESDVNNVEDEPEFFVIEICLDSGAGDHVLSKVDIPGFNIEESEGSRRGRHFVAAGGKRLKNEGQALLHLLGNGGVGLRSVFQVAEVTRPLWSVGKICDQGFEARFTKTKAIILDEQGREVLSFERRNGLYLAMIQLRNPKYKPKSTPGFPGPSR